MAPKGWTTPEQHTWLLARMAPYLDAQKAKVLSSFFRGLFSEWHTQWPEPEPIRPANYILTATDKAEKRALIIARRSVSVVFPAVVKGIALIVVFVSN
jgi:hypothetical protein